MAENIVTDNYFLTSLIASRSRELFIVLSLLAAMFQRGAVADYSAIELQRPAEITEDFGAVVSKLGDIDGDGKADLAVGAPFSGNGRVAIYAGSTRQLIQTISGTNSYDRFGFAIAELGDVNADGRSDFVISAPRKWTTCQSSTPIPADEFRGRVYIYSYIGSSFQALSTLIGGTNAFFGFAVGGVSDSNADLKPDFIVSAPYGIRINNDPCTNYYGTVSLRSGATGSTIGQDVEGGPQQTLFGVHLTRIGDVNLDGREDFAVANPGSGYVSLYSGLNHSVLSTISTDSTSLSALGDVDGDSHPDFLISALGTVGIYSGSAILNYMALRTVSGPISQKFGLSVAGLGDINGDLVADFAVLAGGAGKGSGYVRIYSGATGEQLHFIPGGPADLQEGRLALLGLLDGDLIPDFILGAPNNHDGGHAYVLFSNTPNRNDPLQPYKGYSILPGRKQDGSRAILNPEF